MSLPKPFAARKTDLMISFVRFGMTEPWFTRTWASTNVPVLSSRSPARYRRFYAEARDYEDVAERLGLN